MNNKQKIILTIYVIACCVIAYYSYSLMVDVGFGRLTPTDMQGNPLPSSQYGSTGQLWGGMATLDVIGIIILGIPTLILYKLWRDKK